MKIVLLCWRDTAHPQGGGSERYLERVGEYLARQGHEVIYRSAAFTDAKKTLRRGGVVFQRAGGKYTVYPRALLSLLAGGLRGADVVVDTQNGIPFFARLATRAPVVVLTHHCHKEQWPVAGRLLGRLGWFLESQVAPRVYRGSRWVTVSQASRQELAALGVGDVTVIGNGIDPLPEFPRLVAQGRHIVTLSRLVPHKQIEHAIDALQHLPQDVILDVIGSGWWADDLRDYVAAAGMHERVIFHGHVSEEFKHALLDRALVHVMPSRKEGWGLAVTEAAQHAVPTVGYRSSGGLQDSVDDGRTGVLVEPGSLADAISALLDDPARRQRLGAAARAKAAGMSWEETGRAWKELLEELRPTRE